ncbi:hypothetical protein NGA_0199000 [Nannochloropsis gaditana CCMP526]|uniref:uncharacterized protein n=1 Tax=Nannochloropsis gaditana (strain CCMP526) TaxID=1093141 RepID=UPI00029F6A9E|nr:hypothetical protein NGA_0199000 [Nannochloropsis gaditana CCMP526]EKU21970.1 hypothetical protein NGA_0199000 [Nannochloropsis gaditana CCMP526]|eukprot:XP_005854392.1 hypothetical protein NGA_0199000 [Nannochloropsis gaditana CCMP526]
MSFSSHSSFDVDVLVCGAGAVGLAIVRALARAGREVLVVEAEKSPGGSAFDAVQ